MTEKKTVDTLSIIQNLADEVVDERLAQIEQWGEQNHPSVFSESDQRDFANMADYRKQINDARVELDCLAWDGILLEEVYEALGEADPLLRRQELIQVAAVALAEAECIDRVLASKDNPYEDKTYAAPVEPESTRGDENATPGAEA